MIVCTCECFSFLNMLIYSYLVCLMLELCEEGNSSDLRTEVFFCIFC